MTTLTLRNQKSMDPSVPLVNDSNHLGSKYPPGRRMQPPQANCIRAIETGIIQCTPDPHRGEIINIGLITRKENGETDLYWVDIEEKVKGLGYSDTVVNSINSEISKVTDLYSKTGDLDFTELVHIGIHWTKFISRGNYDIWVRDMLEQFCGRTS